MPRTYKKKKIQTYDSQKVADAIKAVRDGESIRQAGIRYGIPKSTLGDTMRQRYKAPGKPGRRQAISSNIVDKIAKAVAEAARQGIGISRRQLLRRVGELSGKIKVPFKNGQPGKDWFDGFRRRHPELTIRKPEKLATTRARMANPTILRNYFADLNTILNQLGLADQPSKIWNCDETGKQFEHDPVRVIAPKGARSVVGRTTSNRTNVTIMGCVNATGNTMPPMFVVKGKTSRSLHGFNTETGPKDSMWTLQEKGWMNDSLWEIWFREVFLQNCGDARPQLLILDGHSSHETLAILELALQENIHILSLPPHTTHALQPLDRTVFGPLNTAYNTVCSDYLGQNTLNTVNKWTFPGLFKQAWEQAFSVTNIVSGFRACGIFPFNPATVPQEMITPSLPSETPLNVQKQLHPVQSSPEKAIIGSQKPVADGDPQIICEDESSVAPAIISEAPVIEDLALLLALIASGQCQIFSADVNGVATIPNSSEDKAAESPGEAIHNLFLPRKPKTSGSVTCTNVKRSTGHRLLTSNQIIEEKRVAANKKEEKEKKKLERVSEREKKLFHSAPCVSTQKM